MDIKLLAAISATVIGVGFTLPYIYYTIRGSVQPHVYTWIIWTITQGIAAAGVYYGNGGWTAYGMGIGTCMLGLVALLSLRHGTKHITRADTTLFCGALVGLCVWIFTEHKLAAVLLATGIDLLGYIPTIRKTWAHPESESLIMWCMYIVSTFLALGGLLEYNLLTMSYLLMCVPMNTLVFLACLKRFSQPRALLNQ